MDLARRVFSRDLKIAAMRELDAGSTIAHSDDVDQSFRSDADQSGAKRRRALSV
jgi:hypothetical protein